MRRRGSGFRLRWLKHRRNRNGTLRVYVCPPGRKPVRLPTLPENHPEFIQAYQRALEEAPKAGLPAPKAGTLAALAAAYRLSPTWRALARSSQEQREREIVRLLDKAGHVRVSSIAARHIRADIGSLSPGAARNRLKAWRALFGHAVEMGMVERSVADDVKPPKASGEGHHSWTREEIVRFRRAHRITTAARLTFELAYWTGARRSDLCRLGWQHIGRDGWLTYRQTKTSGEVTVPLRELPLGCRALAKDHGFLRRALAHASDRMLFLENRYGAPRSDKAMSAAFRRWCDEAGLPARCSLHGLRKARAAALAEIGWSEKRIGAWTGHQTLKEIVHYTRAANRKTMIAGGERGTNLGTSPEPRSYPAEKAE